MAETLVSAAIRGNVTPDQFSQEFPNLIGDLAKLDLPGSQRALLPDDAYARGHQIVREFDQLRQLGVKYSQIAAMKREPLPGFQECLEQLALTRKKDLGASQ
jgi:hypothetical protein